MRRLFARWRWPYLSAGLLLLAALAALALILVVAFAPSWAVAASPSIAWSVQVAGLRDREDVKSALIHRVRSATRRELDVLVGVLRGDARSGRALARALEDIVENSEDLFIPYRGTMTLAPDADAQAIDAILLIGAAQADAETADACWSIIGRIEDPDRSIAYDRPPPSWHASISALMPLLSGMERARLTVRLAREVPCEQVEGQEVVDFLLRQLDDPEPGAATAALHGLAWRGDPTIGLRLARLGTDPTSIGVIWAWFSAVRDRAAGPTFGTMLHHQDASVRIGAAFTIARCRATAQVPDLIAAAADPLLAPPILIALAELRDARALTLFAEALRDGDPAIRLLAARGLASLWGADAADLLRAAAADDPIVEWVVGTSRSSP